MLALQYIVLILLSGCFCCGEGFECKTGKYGDGCYKDCGLGCTDKVCNKVNGHCECQPGWQPPLCQLVCDAGKYGDACKRNCGVGCKNNVCHKSIGDCECKPGWEPCYCSHECNAYTYGDNCNKSCGSGCRDSICNKVTGHCECAPGWLPPFCHQECDAGKYGLGCKKDCGLGCKTKACNTFTGHCECKPGWLPPLCHLENVALKKTCNMNLGSTGKYSCWNGVNGNTDSSERNCIQSSRIKIPWWGVDLGRPYPIFSITVWAQDGYKNRLKDLKITVDNTHCYTFTSEPVTPSNEININCTWGVILGRIVYLSFENYFAFGDQTFVLNFCEFQVWSCGQQFWGERCERKCGNCIDGYTCDKVTGYCPCKPGFRPPLCLN